MMVRILIAALPLFAAEHRIDTARSTLTVHTGKAGLFSAAAHEHWIDAPISSGTYDDSDAPRIEFKADSAQLNLKPDPKVDAKTQAEIQKTMQESVLESARFPEIAFKSSKIDKTSSGWNVEGTLTLHGVSKTVQAEVKRSGDAYAGRARIKQTDFGIKPVTIGGGLVKVKDELEIEFQIR